MEGLDPTLVILMKILFFSLLFIGGMVALLIIVSRVMNKAEDISEKNEKKVSKGKSIDPVWPNIENKEIAKLVAKRNSYNFFILAFLTIVLSFMIYDGAGIIILLEAVLLIIVGLGILVLSRFFVVAAFALYVLIATYSITVYHLMPSIIWIIVVTLAYVNGIRAVFSYHKLEEMEINGSNDL